MNRLLIFLSILLLNIAVSTGKTWIVANSGYTFSPDNITINQGDSVKFQIASMHNVVEVDEATYTAKGNTPLSGGFSLPYGGGILENITVGTHYYVCSPHASFGMEGIITVNSVGIETVNNVVSNKLEVYPNPTNGMLNISYSLNRKSDVKISLLDNNGRTIEIINADLKLAGKYKMSVSLNSKYTKGIYFIRFDTAEGVLLRKILLM